MDQCPAVLVPRGDKKPQGQISCRADKRRKKVSSYRNEWGGIEWLETKINENTEIC